MPRAPAASPIPTAPALVARAREMFFEQGRDPARLLAPHIARSWGRSRETEGRHHLPEPLAQAQLSDRREQARQLLASAQPELDGLAEHALDHGCVVILSDSTGMVLDVVGSPDFLPRAHRVALMPGVEWSEHQLGTNAIGTALAEREAVMVLGGEHYLAQNGGIGCAAAPILTGRGAVAGVLDISGDVMRVNAHALGLVRMAAQQVEHRMLVAGASGHLLRFHHRPALIGTAREGLMVIARGRIVAANRVALQLFGRDWGSVLDQDAEPLLGLGWARLERQRGLLTLPDGRQIATVLERAPGQERSGASRRADVVVPAAEDEANGGDADVLRQLLEPAVRVADAGVAVLVNGETGSGKDVFARRLHAAGRRRTGPFVAVDCASLPESLIEAELFGYEEGAFTGARRKGMPGRIREAQGGTLFLDEIAEMPLASQTRLLRVLEERVVRPLGGGQGLAVDFDLVCATHGNLQAMVDAKRFRADLMYRVAGYTVHLPPLRERADRRALIMRLFDELGGTARQLLLGEEALRCLDAYTWPGNVRELISVLRTVLALAQNGDVVLPQDLPVHLRGAQAARDEVSDVVDAGMAPAALATLTRHAIDQALAQCGGDVAEAARRLGVHRSTVYRHIARRQRPAT